MSAYYAGSFRELHRRLTTGQEDVTTVMAQNYDTVVTALYYAMQNEPDDGIIDDPVEDEPAKAERDPDDFYDSRHEREEDRQRRLTEDYEE